VVSVVVVVVASVITCDILNAKHNYDCPQQCTSSEYKYIFHALQLNVVTRMQQTDGLTEIKATINCIDKFDNSVLTKLSII